MSPRTRRLLTGPVGLACCAALVLAGCGGDDDGGGGGGGDTVSADAFADDLCSVLSDFGAETKKTIEKDEVADVLSGEAAPQNIDDLSKMITALTTMFGDLSDQFGGLTTQLSNLGVPDVEGGAEFRDTLLDSMAKGSELISEAAAELEDTNPDSLADLSELAPAFEGFEQAFDEVNLDIKDEAPDEITTAIEDSQACQDFEEEYGEL